jgi:hypothetical protein
VPPSVVITKNIYPFPKRLLDCALAVRFPYSSEEPGNHVFERDPCLVVPDLIDFLIVEVKSGRCDLNESWTDEAAARRNLQYALRFMGFVSVPEHVRALANSIYQSGMGQHNGCEVRLAVIGRARNDDLQGKYPRMVQIELLHAVTFVRERLRTPCPGKHRENWHDFVGAFAGHVAKGWDAERLLEWTLT